MEASIGGRKCGNGKPQATPRGDAENMPAVAHKASSRAFTTMKNAAVMLGASSGRHDRYHSAKPPGQTNSSIMCSAAAGRSVQPISEPMQYS